MTLTEFAATDMPRNRSSERLPIELESGVRVVKEPESPALDQPEPAIGLALSEAELADGCLRVRLHLSVKLPGEVAFAYEQLGQAVIITFHDACGERLGQCSMLDPHKRFPGYEGGNYSGPRELDGGGMMVTSYFGATVSFPVEIPAEPDAGPSVFVVATINRLRSEVVRITVAGDAPRIEPEAVRNQIPQADDEASEDQEDQP